MIKHFLKDTNCYFDNIYIISNFIEFDEIGKVKKFDNSKIVHSLNKTMEKKINKRILETIKDKTYQVLIGDLIEDQNMVEQSKWDKTLKIGILEFEEETNLKKYQEAFDIVLTKEDATFNKIEEILF